MQTNHLFFINRLNCILCSLCHLYCVGAAVDILLWCPLPQFIQYENHKFWCAGARKLLQINGQTILQYNFVLYNVIYIYEWIHRFPTLLYTRKNSYLYFTKNERHPFIFGFHSIMLHVHWMLIVVSRCKSFCLVVLGFVSVVHGLTI